MAFQRLERAIGAFLEPYNLVQRFLLGVCVVLLVGFVYAAMSGIFDTSQFEGLSAADHLRRAQALCQISDKGEVSICPDLQGALRELRAIPTSAAEYNAASKYLAAIQQKLDSDVAAEDAARNHSYEQAQKNFQGQARDPFICATSTKDRPIVSFDDRRFWWPDDDGRCTARLQKGKDSEAEIMSFWPTTLRVDTDINSSWLPDEERTCLTHPDDKGKVGTVICGQSESNPAHNIPVKFWGSVERNKTSSWKCRRESDGFVCRAID